MVVKKEKERKTKRLKTLVMIDLSLEGRKVLSIRKNICRMIVPKPRNGREETVLITCKKYNFLM